MGLNINNLKYFVDTVDENSVIKAAKLNFVSQPAISQGIKKLEQELQVELLIHRKNTITPTQEGRYLFEKAQHIFSEIACFESHVEDLKEETSGVLRVGCSTSIAKCFVFPILKEFEKKHSKIDIKLRIGKTSILKKMLDDNNVDFIITVDDQALLKYHKEVLHTGKFILAGKKSATNRIIGTEVRPEILSLKEHLDSTKIKLSPLEIESWDLLYDMAKNRLGSVFIPDFIFNQKDKLQIFNDDYKLPVIKYEVVVCSLKTLRLNKASSKFITELSV